MAWNYRKRVKIAPGVYLNISKKGVSTTVGMRGASMNFGKNGTYINTGIPGTGFYSRQKIGGKQITPASLFVSMSGQPKLRSHRDYVMRFWACVVGAFVMLITGLWIGFIFFAVVGVGQFSNMRRTSVSGGDSVENSKPIHGNAFVDEDAKGEYEYCIRKVYSFSANDPERFAMSCPTCATVQDVVEVAENGIGIYPNPASETITIEGVEVENIVVYNSLGQLVETLASTQYIDVKNYTSGIYTMIINGSENVRFIVK